jgi:hypothetical protein
VLCIQAVALLVALRLGLRIASFASMRRVVSSLASGSSDYQAGLDRVVWAVEASARATGIGNCLAKALAAHVLLRRSGHPSSLKVGVARNAAGGIVAHAWLESGDRVVVGGYELGRYALATGAGQVP